MNSDRVRMTLADLGLIVTGKTPSTKCPEHFGGMIHFVTPSDMDGRKFIDSTERTLAEKGADSVKNAILPAKSVMVSCIGSDMGKVALSGRACVTNQQINSIIVSQDHCADYVYYNLSLRKEELKSLASGSAQPILNKGHFSSVPIELPNRSTQHCIADILGALDDKIELNRRMNRTLEKIAAAIFRSWFIDFDPVHAKAEGRDPGLPTEIADLFPGAFEDSDLGPIPKGWKVSPLTDAIAINPKRTLAKGALAPFLEMSKMPTRGPSPDAWRLREMTSGTKFVNGDTLVARITPCLENGKTAFVDFLHNGLVGWGSTEYIVLRPGGELPPVFAYLLARTQSFRTFAIRQMTGSSGRQRVPPQSLSKFRMALPELNSPVYHALGEVAEPFFNRIRVGMNQNRRLAGLRDTLLPKLLSGEIQLPEPEELVEGVT